MSKPTSLWLATIRPLGKSHLRLHLKLMSPMWEYPLVVKRGNGKPSNHLLANPAFTGIFHCNVWLSVGNLCQDAFFFCHRQTFLIFFAGFAGACFPDHPSEQGSCAMPIGCQWIFRYTTWASHGHGCSQLLEWIWFQRLPIWLNVAEYQKHTANLHIELFNDVFTTHSSGNAPALGVVLLPDNHLWNFAAYCFHPFPSISYGLRPCRN